MKLHENGTVCIEAGVQLVGLQTQHLQQPCNNEHGKLMLRTVWVRGAIDGHWQTHNIYILLESYGIVHTNEQITHWLIGSNLIVLTVDAFNTQIGSAPFV